MSQNKKWLQEGEQTRITPEIRKLAKKLKGSNDLETVFNILKWIKKNLKFVKSWKWRKKYLRTRTVQEIIKSSKSSGCGDKALVFATLVKANGIPAKIVETIDKDWLSAKIPRFISGHTFVDVYLNKKWQVVDPAIGNIGIGYHWPLGKKFVIYKKGLDFWEIGIRNYSDMEKKFNIFKKKWRNSNRFRGENYEKRRYFSD